MTLACICHPAKVKPSQNPSTLGDTLQIILLAQERKLHKENTAKDFGVFLPKKWMRKRVYSSVIINIVLYKTVG